MENDMICDMQSDELAGAYWDMQEMEQYLQDWDNWEAAQAQSEQDNQENFEDYPFQGLTIGAVAQRLEQGTHNPLVIGSNPVGPIKIPSWEGCGGGPKQSARPRPLWVGDRI